MLHLSELALIQTLVSIVSVLTSLPQKLKMAAVLGCFGGVCSNLPDYFSNIQYPVK